MKKEVADIWVKALRSGDYKQCKGALHRDGGFCCLGVLCDIYMNKGVVTKKWRDPGYSGEDEGKMLMGDDYQWLPAKVIRWANMMNDKGSAYSEDRFIEPLHKDELTHSTHRALYDMNDNGFNFNQIADIIEQRYEDL